MENVENNVVNLKRSDVTFTPSYRGPVGRTRCFRAPDAAVNKDKSPGLRAAYVLRQEMRGKMRGLLRSVSALETLRQETPAATSAGRFPVNEDIQGGVGRRWHQREGCADAEEAVRAGGRRSEPEKTHTEHVV